MVGPREVYHALHLSDRSVSLDGTGRGILSLEEAHFRLSGLGLGGRLQGPGTLRGGVAADVLVYDLAKLNPDDAEIVYDQPAGRVAAGAES